MSWMPQPETVHIWSWGHTGPAMEEIRDEDDETQDLGACRLEKAHSVPTSPIAWPRMETHRSLLWTSISVDH